MWTSVSHSWVPDGQHLLQPDARLRQVFLGESGVSSLSSDGGLERAELRQNLSQMSPGSRWEAGLAQAQENSKHEGFHSKMR